MMENKFVCVYCGNNASHKIPFRYLFKGRYLWAEKCNHCGLISTWPRPTPQEIDEMYAEEYFNTDDKQTHHGEGDYLTLADSMDYSGVINEIRKYVPSGNFLEVGCATGALLNQMKIKGFSVTGIEISKFASEYGINKYGIPIINAPFDAEVLKGALPENHFDGILMGDVLEHFTDPKEAMIVACKLLKKGGKLIVHVPGTLNLLSSRLAFFVYRITGSQKTMLIPPYHLTEFSPKTLRMLFLGTGFSKARITQKTKHPKTITLRHSRIENFVKLCFQYPNYLLTKYFGVMGDRITGVGTR